MKKILLALALFFPLVLFADVLVSSPKHSESFNSNNPPANDNYVATCFNRRGLSTMGGDTVTFFQNWTGNISKISYYVDSRGASSVSISRIDSFTALGCVGTPVTTTFGTVHNLSASDTKRLITEDFSSSNIALDGINSIRLRVLDFDNTGIQHGTWGGRYNFPLLSLTNIFVPSATIENSIISIFSFPFIVGLMTGTFSIVGLTFAKTIAVIIIALIALLGLGFGIRKLKQYILGRGDYWETNDMGETWHKHHKGYKPRGLHRLDGM